MTCRLCGQPLKSELERAADDAGNVVHRACYENEIIACPKGPSAGTPPIRAAHAAQRWVALYHLALVELDRGRMPGRLHDARHEMFDRVEELRDLSGSHDVEHQAIQDALAGMRSLDKEQQQWAAQQEPRTESWMNPGLPGFKRLGQEPDSPATYSRRRSRTSFRAPRA